MRINRGSEWRKWDLHFHTQSSYDYKNKSLTDDQIIAYIKEREISVVAVTDHHLIDVDRIERLQKIGRKHDICILPGIEFLADARGSEPIHFIGIFNETSNISFIWSQIENRTDISRIVSEGKKHNEIYCHLSNTIELIKELGGLVTIHAGKKTNGIENITHSLPQGQTQKEDIARLIDIFELGKESDFEGYRTQVIPFLIRKMGKDIPLIICSDNHNVAEYIIKQNLWIKADPNFEGLKQILYEPEQRVKIQSEKPDFKEDRLIIDRVRFVDTNNKFTPDPIYLNENLNVIIGGKSSGKSILLYNIAKTLLADKEFFIKEKIDNKYQFRNEISTFNFEVVTKGGFSQLMYRTDAANSIIPEIKYIPQNYLVKLAEPDENRKGADLNEIVRELINEDIDSNTEYADFVSKVKTNDRKRETIIDAYFDIKKNISSLEQQLSGIATIKWTLS